MENTAQQVNKRIAIIGAGAAGLTAAEHLRLKGYTNITVYERAERPGGKCCSIDIDGRNYEVGAGVLAKSNSTVLDIARRHGVPLQKAAFGESILVDGLTGALLPGRSSRETMRLAWQLLWRYRRVLRRYASTAQPGWYASTPMPAELCEPFSVFAEKNGIAQLAAALEEAYTGYGYGYFSEVPAAYVLKYYSWGIMRSFLLRKMFILPNGIQQLWATVAATHDVRYNCMVSKIVRSREGVEIHTQNGVEKADAVILACPLDDAIQMMEQASQQEQELCSQIQYVDYRTLVLELEHFPKKSGYVRGNFSSQRAGHPVFWYQRYPESPIYTFYALAAPASPDSELIENARQLIEQQGGSLQRVHSTYHWKYFPHVNGAALQNGFYEQLEQMQGAQRTYYAGELCNFSTVGFTADYAADLVERFF